MASLLLPLAALAFLGSQLPLACHAELNKAELREQALEMFQHAYWSYMNNAYPADELMPLSCQGRVRGKTPSRGDVDEALGNFSLTLIDSLDTLIVAGDLDEFERATWLVVRDVRMDSDLVVSVFEANIRVVGGLLSGHLMALLLRQRQPRRLPWYTDQLLVLAQDLADRLLPAFNTTSGVPYPLVNLRHGVVEHLRAKHATCTACGGTMILEFAALSRLTGEPVYEQKARRAMDFLWAQRHRGSDLMGTVLNVHNGDWIRRDSGVGAGIDSYYEYCLKAYILLGDDAYLTRFNKHYEAVMRYVNKGPLFFDVHMHRPTVPVRPFMDSLLAFWPGLQVLKGDLQPAIETHEMLFQMVQQHNFLPEAFTHDFQVHWGQHPLRPEFVESTYFLYKATKDPHYLEVARQVMQSLNEHVRVPCGFAGVKDVRTMLHEDRMDSFVLAETFKYLIMMFSSDDQLIFDPDNFIFTTEAHFLPLTIAGSGAPIQSLPLLTKMDLEDEEENARSCPNTRMQFKGELSSYARLVRGRVRNFVGQRLRAANSAGGSCAAQQTTSSSSPGSSGLRADEFSAGDSSHVALLRKMGIRVVRTASGDVQLQHSADAAASVSDAEAGLVFMQEMLRLSQSQAAEATRPYSRRVVQVLTSPYFGRLSFLASPAQFGMDLDGIEGVEAELALTQPTRGCTRLLNVAQLKGRVAMVERSDCMFEEKAREAERAGAVALVVYDHQTGSSADRSAPFAMSTDGKAPQVAIPVVFLFRDEADHLLRLLAFFPQLVLRLAESNKNAGQIFFNHLSEGLKYGASDVCRDFSTGLKYTIMVDEDGRQCAHFDDTIICFEADNGADEEAASFTGQTIQPKLITKDNALLQVRRSPALGSEIRLKLDTFLPADESLPVDDRVKRMLGRLLKETNLGSLNQLDDYLVLLDRLARTSLGEKLSAQPADNGLLADLAEEIEILPVKSSSEDGINCRFEDDEQRIVCDAEVP